MPHTTRPRVVVFGLGGTIAMTATQSGGVTPTLSAEDLVAAVPGLAETGIGIDVVDFRRLPGASLTFADLDDLLTAITQVLADGATGVVITEGTDPIEEVAYHLDLHYGGPQPVIVTGAMRNPAMAGADGPANLLAAVITAAAASARERGVLVVLNDEIHAASQVRKTHSTSTSAFQSPNSGPLGTLIERSPRWFSGLPIRHVVPSRANQPRPGHPRVRLHTVTLDDDPDLFDDIEQRADGLIVAGMGVGHVPADLVESLAKTAAHIPIVLTSRIGRGASLHSTYGFAGSERDLLSKGLISAGHLDGLKARILLRALINAGATAEHIAQAFAAAGNTTDTPWPWPTHTGDA